MMKRGQPPRPVTDGLPPASRNGARRRDEQHQIKKKSRIDTMRETMRGRNRERTASTGSTRGAFVPHPESKPPVAQVTLSRQNKTNKFRVNASDSALHTDSNYHDLGNIAAIAMDDEECGYDSRKDQQPRNNNQVNQVLNHTPLPPHPDSCDNDSPASVFGRSKHIVPEDQKARKKTIVSQEHKHTFVANRHRPELPIGAADDYSDRSPRRTANFEYNAEYRGRNSSSDSILNGEMFRESKSFTSNDAPSSCIGDRISCGKVDYYAGMNYNFYGDRSGLDSQVNDTFDCGSTKSSCSIIHKSYDVNMTWWENLYAHFIYNDDLPEFTTLQQSFWAVVIGVIMGIITALWGWFIDFCVDFIWKTIPGYLYEIGIFTDVNGHLPLPHYMWICPCLFGGVLSYISALKKIPGQNEWIKSLHSMGIMDHSTLLRTLLISTAGMASGLSLGPELPLVLTAGMVGSIFGYRFKQTILSSRVMNLTAASAAIAGFFGFPMAGALFVLELPHRMGLQYFEALQPAILASIFAVLFNRMVTGDEVKGYFEYPQLNETLPSFMFLIAFAYALVGLSVGAGYAKGCLVLKKWVHDWFQLPDDDDQELYYNAQNNNSHPTENTQLISEANMYNENGNAYLAKNHPPMNDQKQTYSHGVRFSDNKGNFGISHEPTRAALAGLLAGAMVGVICMFVPHSLFWGEAQLQTLIDRGRTPLPVFSNFGNSTEQAANLTAYGYCMHPEGDNSSAQFSTACIGIIAVTKVVVIGLSLGTGIVGGHFWGPLYVGCAASHFFSDIWSLISQQFFGKVIGDYPCVAMLCIMGSAHVVTFRANMAIMLILTLSIKSFTSELSDSASGDYSAIFPLLVVACFLSLQASKSHKPFYAEQRCRGDISAIPEVLCEPNLDGSVYKDSGSFLEQKSTESTTASLNRFGGGSQFTMGNVSMDESDMGFDNRGEGFSGRVSKGNQESISEVSSGKLDTSKTATASYNRYGEDGQYSDSSMEDSDLSFVDKIEEPPVPIRYNNQYSPSEVCSGDVNTTEQRTDGQDRRFSHQQSSGSFSYRYNQGSPSIFSSLNTNSSEQDPVVQGQKFTHRRARSGGTAITDPKTFASRMGRITRSGSLGRSSGSVSSVRSSGKIEAFTASLLDQGRMSAENRSRSNTPRRLSGAIRSRSNTPRRNSGTVRSRSNTPQPKIIP